MRELNVEFMNLYIGVDRFIRDAYSSTEGVSEYIRQMERNASKGIRYVTTWSSDYDRLKRLRWIRNQLSHEVGYDSNICDESDFRWLQNFKERLYSAIDPLSVVRKEEKAELQRLAEARKRYKMQSVEQPKPIEPVQQVQNNLPKKKSFWQRLKDFFS